MQRLNLGYKKCLFCGTDTKIKVRRDIKRKKFCSNDCQRRYNMKNGIFSFKGRKLSEESRKKISISRLSSKKPDELFYIIDKKTNCWIYTGCIDSKGYGVHCYLGKYIKAHRYFYEKYRGKIPGKLPLDHLCRNTKCVNPLHLEPVSNKINCRRGSNSKINMEIAKEIRNLYIPNVYGYEKLSKQFGISPREIYRIIKNKRWI